MTTLWLAVLLGQLGGYLRFEAYVQTQDPYALQKLATTFQSRLDLEGDRVHGYGAFNVIFDALQGRPLLRPIEGYVTASVGAVDLTVGRRILTWGEGVFVSPSDVVTPWNFTFLYTDLEEFREGVETVSLTYYRGLLWFQAAVLPWFRPNQYPLEPFRIPSLTFEPDSAILPSPSLKNAGLLARWGGTWGPLDFQVFVYRGYDPDFNLRVWERDPDAWLVPVYHRTTFYGGNGVWIHGNRALHVDLMYRGKPENHQENDLVKGAQVYLAVGGEASSWNDQIHGGVDFLYRKTWPQATPGIPAAMEALAREFFFEEPEGAWYTAYRFQWKDARELWHLQVMGIYDWSHQEAFTLPSLTYSLADGVHLRWGALLSDTKGKSPFTQIGKHVGNLVFTEVRWSF